MNSAYSASSSDELMRHMVGMLSQQNELMASMVDTQRTSGLKLDSRLPSYGGSLAESFALFYDQMVQYFEARNVAWEDSSISTRVLAVLGSALHGTAAQWYVMMKPDLSSVQQFFEMLEREFVPADLQLRLREELRNLNQRNCRDLADYVTRFRGIMNQVTQMTHWIKSCTLIKGCSRLQGLKFSTGDVRIWLRLSLWHLISIVRTMVFAPEFLVMSGVRITKNERMNVARGHTLLCRWKSTTFK